MLPAMLRRSRRRRPIKSSGVCPSQPQSVALTRTILPSVPSDRYPHGACSKRSRKSPSVGSNELIDRCYDGGWCAQIGAMAGGIEVDDAAAVNRLIDILAHPLGCDDVVTGLQDKRFSPDIDEVSPIVGCKRYPGKLPGNIGIGAAERVGQFLAELGSIRIAHDCGRHCSRPAEMVVGQGGQQLFDLVRAETAFVAIVLDIARRWPHHDEL